MDNNKNKKISEKLFDVTVDRYNKEFERCQHLDNKAGTAIGFSGVIVSIIGIIFYSTNIADIDDVEVCIIFFWNCNTLTVNCVWYCSFNQVQKNDSSF